MARLPVRSPVVVATTIPLAMLGAFAFMSLSGTTGNLMSLGAIDFGLVVDGAVVLVEGPLAAMAAEKIDASRALSSEARVVGRPLAYGVVIIAIVYVPVLLLEGVEDKMFRPMAWTVLFALATAIVLTFTWVPALASVALGRAHSGDPRVVRWLRRGYDPVLDFLLRRPAMAIVLALVMLGLGVLAGATRGVEFVPRLEEGALVVQVTRPPSVSLEEAIAGTTTVERTLRQIPEVAKIVSRTGSPDVATVVMGLEQSDVFVMLEPRERWRPGTTRESLSTEMADVLRRELPRDGVRLHAADRDADARAPRRNQGRRRTQDLRRRSGRSRAARRACRSRHRFDSRRGRRTVEPLSGLPLLTVRPDRHEQGV